MCMSLCAFARADVDACRCIICVYIGHMCFLASEGLLCVSVFASLNGPMAQAEQVAPWIPMAALKLARFD